MQNRNNDDVIAKYSEIKAIYDQIRGKPHKPLPGQKVHAGSAGRLLEQLWDSPAAAERLLLVAMASRQKGLKSRIFQREFALRNVRQL